MAFPLASLLKDAYPQIAGVHSSNVALLEDCSDHSSVSLSQQRMASLIISVLDLGMEAGTPSLFISSVVVLAILVSILLVCGLYSGEREASLVERFAAESRAAERDAPRFAAQSSENRQGGDDEAFFSRIMQVAHRSMKDSSLEPVQHEGYPIASRADADRPYMVTPSTIRHKDTATFTVKGLVHAHRQEGNVVIARVEHPGESLVKCTISETSGRPGILMTVVDNHNVVAFVSTAHAFQSSHPYCTLCKTIPLLGRPTLAAFAIVEIPYGAHVGYTQMRRILPDGSFGEAIFHMNAVSRSRDHGESDITDINGRLLATARGTTDDRVLETAVGVDFLTLVSFLLAASKLDNPNPRA